MLDNKQLAEHWHTKSDNDFEAMLVLVNNKYYTQGLFFGHLAIEKLFKAIFALRNPKVN